MADYLASMAVTEEEAWRDYIRERRVEMAYEGNLYWSYLRWGKYGGYANEGEKANGVDSGVKPSCP